MIEVRLFAFFRDNRGKVLHLDVAQFTTPQAVLDYLKIKLEDVAILLVNGRHAPADTLLKAEDIVAFFPPVAGG
jgi:molybdopterin synthase sulfur carrier subunit